MVQKSCTCTSWGCQFISQFTRLHPRWLARFLPSTAVNFEFGSATKFIPPGKDRWLPTPMYWSIMAPSFTKPPFGSGDRHLLSRRCIRPSYGRYLWSIRMHQWWEVPKSLGNWRHGGPMSHGLPALGGGQEETKEVIVCYPWYIIMGWYSTILICKHIPRNLQQDPLNGPRNLSIS